jgi:molecular chaperone GrpE
LENDIITNDDMVKESQEAAPVSSAEESAQVLSAQEELQQELDKAREEAKKNFDLYMRALAEAENTRKRAQRDRDEYIKFACLPIIKKLLPAMDDLKRALDASQNSQDYKALQKGVELIFAHLNQILEAEGVEAIECLGQPFDPQLHQPLMVESSEEYEENMVIEELQKGYKMKGRVIRPSLVKVSG